MEGLAVHPSTGYNLLAHGQSDPPQALTQDQHSCSAIIFTAFEDIGIVVNVADDLKLFTMVQINHSVIISHIFDNNCSRFRIAYDIA